MARVVRLAGVVLIESFDWSNVSQRTEQLNPRSCHKTDEGWNICFDYLLTQGDMTSVITYVI